MEFDREGLDLDAVSSLLASAEIDHQGGDKSSSTLAIHVYSKLAMLHQHRVIPYLPRIMASVLSFLSTSPQLHPACTQVMAALVAHTINPVRDPSSNEDALRNLCRPLLSALSCSHPPHLAPGAASCLQTLVVSDRWKCAPLDLQELVCVSGTNALTDKGIQTVPHIRLMHSLTQFSSSVVIQGYGSRLLAAGMDILQSYSSTTPKRLAAAQLLESVLKIVDAELLDLDISPIVGALQDCQQDRVAGVRTAIADALKTASMYAGFNYTAQGANPLAIEENVSSLTGLGTQITTSPAAELKVSSDKGFSHGGTPCHGTVFGSTPSSGTSDKWLKRLPLAPLQQPSEINMTCLDLRKRPMTFNASDHKENFAPPYNSRPVASSRDRSRATWMSKRQSPLLPNNVTAKTYSKSPILFNSPQTPIPFCEGIEGRHGEFSVTSLHEKHFGKERDCFDDQIPLSLVRCNVKMIGSAKDAMSFSSHDQESEGEAWHTSDIDRSGSRSMGGAEGLNCHVVESTSECESSMTSEIDPNYQVMADPMMEADLLTTPKGLISFLQYDDSYQLNLGQEDCDVELSSGMGCDRYRDHDLDESEEDDYVENSNVDNKSEGSDGITRVPSEKSNLYHGSDAWKEVVRRNEFVDVEEPEMAWMLKPKKHWRDSFSKKGKTRRHKLVNSDCDEAEVDPALYKADSQTETPNVELRNSKPTRRMKFSVHLWVSKRTRGFLVLVFLIGVFYAAAVWLKTFMGDFQASNTLVPT